MASGLRGIRSNYTLLKGSNPAAVIHCGETVNLDDIKQFRYLHLFCQLQLLYSIVNKH